MILQVVAVPVAIGSIVFILINGHRILQGQGCYFLEEWYNYLVPTVKNIFSDINVKYDWQIQTATKTCKLLVVTNNYYQVDMMKLIIYFNDFQAKFIMFICHL